MLRLLKSISAVALIFAIGVGCDSSSPTAPEATLALSVIAVPDVVEVRLTSLVTIVGTLDGAPAADVVVRLSTDFGALSAASVTLDNAGRAQVTFTAPAEEGIATVTAASGAVAAETMIEVEATAGLVAEPDSLELEHSRSASRCENPIFPIVEVTNFGSDPVDFEVVADLPDWLTVDVFSGSVPGTFQAIFTCVVDDGDLDLAHSIRLQGKDPTTGDEVGLEVAVEVVVRVRD